MAYIEPNSTIKLLEDVPLDPGYENTLYFNSVQQQTEYFSAKSIYTLSNQSYARRTKGVLRVGWNADQYPNNTIIQKMYNCSYMMFRNDSYENKWFYAFVDMVEYVNNNTVDLYFHIDVMQTWHFDYVLNQCFIERQHTTGDTFGVNTIPEKIETGPYESTIPEFAVDGAIVSDGLFPYTPKVCLITTFDTQGAYADGYFAPGRVFRGSYFTGVNYYLYNIDQTDLARLNTDLAGLVSGALKDGVVSLLMVPSEFFDPNGNTQKRIYFTMPNSLGNYTPRNKKLLCYPYNLFYVYNNQGISAEYKYEDFAADTRLSLEIWGNISANPGLLCAPYNYKKVNGVNYEEKITLGGFPMCSWSYDSFKAWLAQNAGTITAGAAGLIGSWAIALANPVAGLLNGSMGISNGMPYIGRHSQMGQNGAGGYVDAPSTGLIGATLGALGQLYDHSRRPPQAVGDSNGDLLYQSGLCTFSFVQKHIKAEYARIIDDYFDMYGYSINRSGVPNRAARPCYTYVKTIGCSIHGDIPADDASIIQKLFDNGIRFWRSTAVFGNYDPSVNNNRV